MTRKKSESTESKPEEVKEESKAERTVEFEQDGKKYRKTFDKEGNSLSIEEIE